MNNFTIKTVNELNKQLFIDQFGSIFEYSPWVAEQAFLQRPFSSIQSLHEIMCRIVQEASAGDQLALLKKHPNLGSKIKMTDTSRKEQEGAGLTSLSELEYQEFSQLNDAYMKKFDFPFIMAVQGKSKEDIYLEMKKRIHHNLETEFATARAEVFKIAQFRLTDLIQNERRNQMQNITERQMYYGKGNVFAYRTYLKPLKNVRVIPESSFSGRSNILFGVNVQVTVGGKSFLTSFTEGDNSLVVATDSMKNFVQRHLGSYTGSTIEGFLKYVGEAFLNKYPQMETVELTGDEVSFETTSGLVNGALSESQLVFNRSRNEYSQSFIKMERIETGNSVVEQHSFIRDLQLIKIQGNSFTGFVRDEYTTLPEDSNRPLFIYLNIGWVYSGAADALGNDPLSYVAAEQVRDIACSVFNETETPSIQHLIYLIGCKILKRFPQLKEVKFESQNHTWDLVVEGIPNSAGKVYTEPRPPFGFQVFTVTQEDMKTKQSSTSLEGTK